MAAILLCAGEAAAKKAKGGKKAPVRPVDEELAGFKGSVSDLDAAEDDAVAGLSSRRGRRALRKEDEKGTAEDGGKLRLEHFDRNLPIVLEVRGQVDSGHPARAELTLDSVLARERQRQVVELGGDTHGS